jgi:hypothetical protein
MTSSPAASTTASSTGGGGIPEFPYQVIVATVFAAVLVASYLLIRRRSRVPLHTDFH